MLSRSPFLKIALVALAVWHAEYAAAVETVLFNNEGRPRQLTGQVVIEDTAGSVLLETADGGLWPILANTIQTRSSSAEPLSRLDKDGLADKLLEEMGPGFQVYRSKHYVVVYNTTRKYAHWCSSLLERLQRGFLAYWEKRGFDLHEPEHPLPVVVFGNKESYLEYARDELGPAAGSAIGFYSLQTNRITMYDLTGLQAMRREDSRRGSLHDITAMLSEPDAAPLVATIVHEATHQIAFNCGMQKRFGSNPVWLGEGLAMFCETPDLFSNRSWSGIGKVNYERWDRYRENANADRAAPLRALIADDNRIRNPRTAVDAYAEAWAWSYFLITWHTNSYVAYLKMLEEKPLMVVDDKQTRLADFAKHFGSDFQKLEEEFYRRMSRIE
jgi:hypothetical protein